jgi:hypothetical protein
VLLALAASSPNLTVLSIITAVGFVVGVYGHIIRSRPLILAGIVMIGLAGAYVISRGQFSGS